MENQIHLWNNNLEFFKMSRNADALRADVQKKIEGLEAEMKKHREKMKAVQAEIKAMKEAQTENNA
jgi:chaperonin cofactor prefoldin